jgi:hypothetical protein
MSVVTTTFKPSVHGWPFTNADGFNYSPAALGLTSVSVNFGLCGGMCFSALDRYFSCRSIDRTTSKPQQGDALYDELLRRQIDSLTQAGGGWIWAKVLDWQARADIGHWWQPHSLKYLTRHAWPQVKASIDAGDPMTLCLIQARGTDNPSDNHQVVAYKYEITGPWLCLWVYDPNGPDDDDVRIIAKISGGDALRGHRTNSSDPMRGFFGIPWSGPTGTQAVKVKTLDFVPASGSSYDLNWPGPPRRNLQYADVKHYTPSIVLDSPTPRRLTLGFWVKESRSLWFDDMLGSFTAIFNRCSTVPDDIVCVNVGVGGQTPAGAPAQTRGTFWLGATKKGKVRGNEGRGDDRDAEVYLEAFEYFSLPGESQSRKHHIRAI